MGDLRILDDAELDLVSGGAVPGFGSLWQYCALGTTAGGTEGAYPLSAQCRTTPAYGSIGSAIVAGANAALHHQ